MNYFLEWLGFHSGVIPEHSNTDHYHQRTMSYSQLSDNARHLVAKFTLATSLEVAQGVAWYSVAWETACNMAKSYELSPYICAGVIAALSPRNKWPDNVRNADTLCKVYAAGGTVKDMMSVPCRTPNANKSQAITILTTPAAHVSELLTGPKRKEFYDCIARPEINNVCIDGHAYSCWLGTYIPASKTPHIGKKLRVSIKQDYRDATSFINEELDEKYKASDIQAITWVTHKRIHNV